MRDITIRTAGATLVLFGVTTAAILQIGPAIESGEISLANEPLETTVTPASVTSEPTEPVETTLPPPFVYRVGVLSGISTDNFWAFYGGQSSVWDAYILGPTKPALYTLKHVDGTLNGELATSPSEPSEGSNGWQVTIDLSKDLRWSDGAPITARDVVFTFDTVRALKLGGSWASAFPAPVSDITAIGDSKLRIRFSERPTLAVWPYGPGLAPIMPQHVWAPLVDGVKRKGLYALDASADVDGGALSLATVEDDRITSVANPGHPRGAAPDIVEYHIYSDEAAAVGALTADEIDYILSPKGLEPSQVEAIKSDPAIAIATSPANAVRYLGFNLNRAPMSDHAFRSSLALLLDRRGLAGSISNGTPAYSFVSESNTRWYDEKLATANRRLYDGDLAVRLSKAVASLTAAGYAWESEPTLDAGEQAVAGTGLTINGVAPAPLTILTPGDAYDPARPAYAAQIAETLGWLGFDVRPVETDFDTVVDLAFTAGDDGALHYDMYLLGWTLGNPSLPGYYRPLFAGDGVMNNTGYSSASFAEQLSAYEGSYTFAEAREVLWAMEATLAVDLPYLLLYRSDITEVYRLDRVAYGVDSSFGGLQGRLGGIGDVTSVG